MKRSGLLMPLLCALRNSMSSEEWSKSVIHRERGPYHHKSLKICRQSWVVLKSVHVGNFRPKQQNLR
jgi:hypothetical protein